MSQYEEPASGLDWLDSVGYTNLMIIERCAIRLQIHKYPTHRRSFFRLFARLPLERTKY